MIVEKLGLPHSKSTSVPKIGALEKLEGVNQEITSLKSQLEQKSVKIPAVLDRDGKPYSSS